ncbi:hypothetical protein EKK58_05360 [Candidatus Dependentiae bacterium]|nr:MAG: hypothetical protein EKK58_05360 [Candidatus Dependentiae bacterium]
MALKTWDQIGKECRAKMRRMSARFADTCGKCKRAIAVGDTIVKPCYATDSSNRNRGIFWYCEDCGEFEQRGVDCGYLVARGPWLNQAERDAFMEKPDVKAWLDEYRQRQLDAEARAKS